MHSEGPSVRPTSITAYCVINESTTPVMTSPRVHPCPPKTRHVLSSSKCDSKRMLPVEDSRRMSVCVRCMGSFLSWREGKRYAALQSADQFRYAPRNKNFALVLEGISRAKPLASWPRVCSLVNDLGLLRARRLQMGVAPSTLSAIRLAYRSRRPPLQTGCPWFLSTSTIDASISGSVRGVVLKSMASKCRHLCLGGRSSLCR